MSLAQQAAEAEPTERLTIADALALAGNLHRRGEFDGAETIYGTILQAVPDCVDALQGLGILLHQTERSEAGVRLIERAITLEPHQAGLHSNLGNVFLQRDRPRDAARAYRTALRLDPGNADVRNNYGACQRRLGLTRGAEASYRAAIASNPRHRDALNNLGRLLLSEARFDEAIRSHAQALELAPKSPDSRRFIVSAYVAAGDIDLALLVAEEWLRDEPESATARHSLAAISGRDVPARASDAFVQLAFDRFAASFDSKLAALDYRAPELVAKAVHAACGEPSATLAVFDAGCGTGLCGPLLRPYAADLVGADLSAGMLDKARERACYDDLIRAELTGYLQDQPARFDLVVSADTLCYFGDLSEVLAAARGAAFVSIRMAATVTAPPM